MAIESALQHCFGLAKAEIAVEACRLLGIHRVTEETWQVVECLLADMLTANRLEMRGEPGPS